MDPGPPNHPGNYSSHINLSQIIRINILYILSNPTYVAENQINYYDYFLVYLAL